MFLVLKTLKLLKTQGFKYCIQLNINHRCILLRLTLLQFTSMKVNILAEQMLGEAFKFQLGLILVKSFPRCMECQRGLATRKVSVCPSVRLSVPLSNACIVTKRKKDLSRFLYHTKNNLA